MAAKTIRDPIHGNIRMDGVALALLDTWPMQRLRHIRQNGFCFLVYPAMNSTRFEHSLGVYHLGVVMADHLKLSEDEKTLLSVAGLLHDVGHGPFSHTCDEVFAAHGITHEQLSIKTVQQPPISEVLIDNGLDPEKVAEVVNSEGKLGKILSSGVDIDKMDYLIRDAYYAGVTYGVIDLARVIQTLRLFKQEVVVDLKGLEAAESLLISRNLMYQTVYRHHAKRIVESMFRHAVSTLFAEEKLSLDEFIAMDDIDLVHTLRSSGGYPEEIMRRIDERRLFKDFFSGRVSALEEVFRKELSENTQDVEEKISKDLGVPPGFLILDYPQTRLSEFKVQVEVDGCLKPISEVSPLAQSLAQSEWDKLSFHLYTTPEHLGKAKSLKPSQYFPFTQTRLSSFTMP